MNQHILFFALIHLILFSAAINAGNLKDNETVIFFKVDAAQASSHLEKGKARWNIPLHAWVFEEENESIWRNKLKEKIINELGTAQISADSKENIDKRLNMFLVDSQGFKSFNFEIENQTFSFGPSSLNGHIYKKIQLALNSESNPLNVFVNKGASKKNQRHFSSVIRLIPRKGLSIISDIDDTIKDSHVLNKQALIKNTLLRPAKPVDNMSQWYQCLEKMNKNKSSNAYFHYISASPWQLYPMLNTFLEQYQFPEGSLYLRKFRIKDSSFFDFLKPSMKYKILTITQLMKQFPERDFILIGDSGEHDPEVYATVLKEFKTQVKKIYIRKVPESDLSEERFRQAYSGSDKNKLILFSELDIIQSKYCQPNT